MFWISGVRDMSPGDKGTPDRYSVQVSVAPDDAPWLHARSILSVLVDFAIYFVEYLFIERRRVVSFDGDAETIRIDIVDYHIIVLSENAHDLRPFVFFAIYSVVFHMLEFNIFCKRSPRPGAG